MRSSQARRLPPLNRANALYAETNVSWATSSAAVLSPRMRAARLYTLSW